MAKAYSRIDAPRVSGETVHTTARHVESFFTQHMTSKFFGETFLGVGRARPGERISPPSTNAGAPPRLERGARRLDWVSALE
jgi:hypothetical protein